MKINADKDNKIIIKRLTEENKRLREYTDYLEKSLSQIKEDYENTLKEYNESLNEIKNIRQLYKDSIKDSHKIQKQYSAKVETLIKQMGGTDMND